MERIISTINMLIADAIPDRKAELIKDLESVTPHIKQYGGDEDRGWFESVRREIWMEARAFER